MLRNAKWIAIDPCGLIGLSELNRHLTGFSIREDRHTIECIVFFSH